MRLPSQKKRRVAALALAIALAVAGGLLLLSGPIPPSDVESRFVGTWEMTVSSGPGMAPPPKTRLVFRADRTLAQTSFDGIRKTWHALAPPGGGGVTWSVEGGRLVYRMNPPSVWDRLMR